MLLDVLLRRRTDRRGLLVLGASSAAALAGLHPRARLFVLGDSWAAGLHADPAHALGQVAAARLGWQVRVDAVSGTGYLNGAGSGTAYPQRAARLRPGRTADVVVLQGGSNDDRLAHEEIPQAVAETVRLVTARFPRARLALLGPGPDPAPVTEQQRDVDLLLTRTAADLALPYVSMLQEGWIPAAGPTWIIDPANAHPTVAGQRYLGDRLAAALKRLYPDLAA